jgi:beta-N-acetylhexosaminidase
LSDEEFCNEIHKQASDLEYLNFNWTLAPVIDVSPNNKDWISSRIIDKSPEIVGEIANKYSKCMHNKNIYTTAKHFPGHGSTSLDSHLVIPKVNKSKSDWESSDAIPFAITIADNIKFIMTGHLHFYNIDNEIASLSSFWMNDILRNTMNYQNLIVTDDMVMLHPKNSVECANLISKAINNGADISIFVHSSKCNIDDVLNEINSRKLIDTKRLDESINRILIHKKEFLCQ